MMGRRSKAKLWMGNQHIISRRKLGRWAALTTGVLFSLSALYIVLISTTGGHTLLPVSYAQNPPNQGNHSPVWQRCGFYSVPVDNEHAVHSLEHGALWITYQPDLPHDQKEVLRAFARLYDDVVVSPYPGLPTSAIVSAWGRQIPLDVIDTRGLDQAIAEIRIGPDAPEAGGGCDGTNLWFTGSTGEPES